MFLKLVQIVIVLQVPSYEAEEITYIALWKKNILV